jgi:hypothetical protein
MFQDPGKRSQEYEDMTQGQVEHIPGPENMSGLFPRTKKEISGIWEHVPGLVKNIPRPENKSELCPRTKERDLRNMGTCPRTSEKYSKAREQVRTMS